MRRRPCPRPPSRARHDRLMRPRRLPREEEATLVEHLEELRGRIMVGLAAVAVATAVAFVFHDHILEWLAQPLPPEHRHLAAFGVAEPFSVSIAVSLYAGILLALPVILWQLWSFLVPALDPAAERRILGFAALRPRPGGRRARVRLRDPAAAGRALPHRLRHDALQAPAAREQLLLLRGHRAARRRLRLRDAARRARRSSTSVCSRRPGCAGTGARATSSSRPWRWRCPGPDPVTTMLELLPMLALFESSIWLAAWAERRAARLSVAGAQA